MILSFYANENSGSSGLRLAHLKARALRCFFAAVVVAAWALVPALSRASETIRVGYFPNITHAQVLAGLANGQFQKALGDGVKIETRVFNAGPSAVEALFAGAIDLAYIGPSPSINAYVKTGGEFKIIAGSCSGGVSLIVRNAAGIKSIEDFHGKRIATPQLGNTQDMACRAWLKEHGFKTVEKGGDVRVIPVANPDQLTLFQGGDLDAAWTAEPWASRLVEQGGGRVFLREEELWKKTTGGEFITVQILVSKKFLETHQDLVKKWLGAHVAVTEWIKRHPRDGKALVNAEIGKLTGKALPGPLMDKAWKNLKVTYDPIPKSLEVYARWAFEQGYLGQEPPDLTGIYDLTLLHEVLGKTKKGR